MCDLLRKKPDHTFLLSGYIILNKLEPIPPPKRSGGLFCEY